MMQRLGKLLGRVNLPLCGLCRGLSQCKFSHLRSTMFYPSTPIVVLNTRFPKTNWLIRVFAGKTVGSHVKMIVQHFFYKQLSKHLAQPGGGVMGWYTLRRMERVNKHLAVNCVRLLDIKPNDRVLEVGFGTGIGLETAYKYVKDGSGVIYGIDPSKHAFKHVYKRLEKEISESKIRVFPLRLPLLKFNKNFFHRIYHTNCYYFWWNMTAACTELHSILKPHGKMVTTLNIDRLKALKAKGGFHVGDYDPLRYMAALESVGFQNVRFEYLTDTTDRKFKEYQAIFAEVGSKEMSEESELKEDVEPQSYNVYWERTRLNSEEAVRTPKEHSQPLSDVDEKRAQAKNSRK